MNGFKVHLEKKVCYIQDLLLRGCFHRILELEGPTETIMCGHAIFGTYLY